jgi:hypothetical protein
MSNHKRKAIEWVLRGVEMVAVFSAMSWVLFWAATRGRQPVAPSARGPGHWLDSDDPDGAAALERSRRRRHID